MLENLYNILVYVSSITYTFGVVAFCSLAIETVRLCQSKGHISPIDTGFDTTLDPKDSIYPLHKEAGSIN